ncbi:hypothetical protein [Pulveribacter sp.]|uniref:hypothetical protein n=1 Tax=Pulveribacter sp. TaxID=2678893 RepID=UPI0028B0C954|nr:hypothetical protein [Pulveribacter sp.]
MNPLPTAAWGAALTALLLAGCASRESLVPQVRQDVAADGAKTVSVAADRLACERGARCPVLAASWSSARAGQAELAIGLPGVQSQVTGADVHIGGSEVVRLRSSQANVQDGMSRFDVPLRLVDRLAYAQRVWMRVYTADGAGVDEYVNSGEQSSRAAEAMAHFLAAVQKAGGAGAGVEGPSGGLFDRLGGKDKP